VIGGHRVTGSSGQQVMVDARWAGRWMRMVMDGSGFIGEGNGGMAMAMGEGAGWWWWSGSGW
jgi:hypothetical protein